MKIITPLLLLLPLGGLQAQTRDYRALRDSLAAYHGGALSQLESRDQALANTVPSNSAAQRLDALMQRGLILLRLSEESSRQERVKAAVELFVEAAELAPAFAWAHYGLALAYLASPEVRVGGGILSRLTIAQVAAEIVGEDPRSKAVRELKRAVELDPTFTEACLQLGSLALESRTDTELQAARQALLACFQARKSYELAIALADVAVASQDLPLAETAINALSGFTMDPSVSLHVRAAVLMRLPGQESRGTAAYLEGLNRLSEAAAARYHADVSMLATDLERAQWQDALDSRQSLEARRKWLVRFWDVRAARSAIRVEARIIEHYRRLDVALGKYRRSQKRGAAESASVLLESQAERLPFDDRGLIYLRFGKPDRVIRTTARGLHPNETWVYDAVEGERRFFHLVASRGSHDFVLVDNIFAAAEDPAPPEAIVQLLEDRTQLDPKYAIFAARIRSLSSTARRDRMLPELRGTGASDALTSVQLENSILSNRHRQDVMNALRRDAAERHFDTSLPFYYDLFGMKGADDRTDLTAAFAVPGNFIKGTSVDGRLVYALDVSVIFIDTLDSRVERRDTTVRFWSSRELGRRDNVRFHLNLRAPPSSSSIQRILIHDLYAPAAGTVYRGKQEVPDFGGSHLVLSDLVIADSSTHGPWQRDVIQLSLLPPRSLIPNQLFSLFYEIYNLPAGDSYRTELRIEPIDGNRVLRKLGRLFGGGGNTIRVSFDERSSSNLAGTQQQVRQLRADLKPGRYRLRVTVTNLRTAESATRTRSFIVRSG